MPLHYTYCADKPPGERNRRTEVLHAERILIEIPRSIHVSNNSSLTAALVHLDKRPTIHATKVLWNHDLNILAFIMIIIIQWGHKFARVTTAKLSWHVQNCDLIWFYCLDKENVIFFYEIWVMRS